MTEDLPAGKTLKVLKSLIDSLLAHVGNLANEGEVLFGGEEVDEETFVDISAGFGLPFLRFGRVDAVEGYCSCIRLQQVEQHTEEGGFSCSVVTYESEDVPVVDGQFGNIAGDGLAKLLL